MMGVYICLVLINCGKCGKESCLDVIFVILNNHIVFTFVEPCSSLSNFLCKLPEAFLLSPPLGNFF